jgi:hypothetical protein
METSSSSSAKTKFAKYKSTIRFKHKLKQPKKSAKPIRYDKLHVHELKREAIDCQKKLARFLLNGRPISLGQAVDAYIRSESLASSSMTVAEAIAIIPAGPRPLNSPVAALVGRRMEEVERELILETLGRCLGNRTRAAEILGISIRTLRNKLHEYRGQGVAVPPAASQLAPGELMPLERG